ncbi:MAG: A/G-specific adenine glycosylase [Candidatus Omnitrophica bacterium]|nr:A/G-specific adenine glycosylase [Candidatus Omnitrophota bacterium]
MLKRLSPDRVRAFRRKVYRYYKANGRDLPWRKTRDPYRIVVSEIMLQQTQVDRVALKYPEFIKRFPTIRKLAKTPVKDVFTVWQGMGYNRRALSLKRLAEQVVRQYSGRVPDDEEALRSLPGIGSATASSICAFAFNKPVVFIETNIRSVFIHEFFCGRQDVSDAAILPFVGAALDRKNPCRWYNALMDYGVMLKKKFGNPGRKSAHYVRQSKFEGSNRQVRGAILKILIRDKELKEEAIIQKINTGPERVISLLNDLQKEGLLKRSGGYVTF